MAALRDNEAGALCTCLLSSISCPNIALNTGERAAIEQSLVDTDYAHK